MGGFWAICATNPGQAADLRSDATNKGIVELETGASSGVSVRIAEDLAGLVDDGATRRVLPVIGHTALQNLWDLVLLRGIDMSILQIDALDAAQQERSLPGAAGRFEYITKLYNEEFHLLAGAAVKSVADLAHQRVDVGLRGSGTDVTAERLFELLKVPADLVHDGPEIALGKLRHGHIAAVALVAGKPASLFASVRHDEALHFISIPLAADVIKTYVPTSLSADDYPELIEKQQTVGTVAVGSVLAVAKLQPGSDRYRNVSNFVDVFFTEFRTLLEPGHQAKWEETNLAAELPELTRFAPAQQWLSRNAAVARQPAPDTKNLFSRFLDSRQGALDSQAMSDEQKAALFNQFQLWQSGQAH